MLIVAEEVNSIKGSRPTVFILLPEYARIKRAQYDALSGGTSIFQRKNCGGRFDQTLPLKVVKKLQVPKFTFMAHRAPAADKCEEV